MTGSTVNSHSIVSLLAFSHHYCIIKVANFGYSVSFVVLWGREVDYLCLYMLVKELISLSFLDRKKGNRAEREERVRTYSRQDGY